jgi:hypothetical protein
MWLKRILPEVCSLLIVCVIVLLVARSFRTTLPNPENIGKKFRFESQIWGPLMLTCVKDTDSGVQVFWYDFDNGPIPTSVNCLSNGDWTVTFHDAAHLISKR